MCNMYKSPAQISMDLMFAKLSGGINCGPDRSLSDSFGRDLGLKKDVFSDRIVNCLGMKTEFSYNPITRSAVRDVPMHELPKYKPCEPVFPKNDYLLPKIEPVLPNLLSKRFNDDDCKFGLHSQLKPFLPDYLFPKKNNPLDFNNF